MPRRRLTAATEQLLLLIRDRCPGADYEAARDLAEASALSEIQAVAEAILRRLERGEGRNWHAKSVPNGWDLLIRAAVEKLIRSEAGIPEL